MLYLCSVQQYGRDDTICALSTGRGGALGLIRISGKDALTVASTVFSQSLLEANGYKAYFGKLLDGTEVLDECIATVFLGPSSFTGEDTVEFAVHGSPYITERLLQLLTENGASMALPGEFTMRAYLNGKMDLAQAEAIGDLITSSNKASHKLAFGQMKGRLSQEIDSLRSELLHFASMIELELDFGEEDVEFASRPELQRLVDQLNTHIAKLLHSFRFGNAIHKGIPVAIVGEPNAGKSTLLNQLLEDERAIVSDIPGTTRDSIEERLHIEDVEFRFMDTAGIRDTQDKVERIGIDRSYAKAKEAAIVLFLVPASQIDLKEVHLQIQQLKDHSNDQEKKVLLVINKTDLSPEAAEIELQVSDTIAISAKDGTGLDKLRAALIEFVQEKGWTGDEVMITNVRHAAALQKALESLERVNEGLQNGLSGDLLALDIRQALRHLASILGEIDTEEILGHIFSSFCIGK